MSRYVDSIYWKTSTCSTFHGIFCLLLLYPFSPVSDLYVRGCSSSSTISVVLFVPGQGYMPTTFKELFFIVLIGVRSLRCLSSKPADLQIFGFCGQTFVTLGLQREKAGRAGLAIYTSVFFAIILELLIFHTLPSFLSLVGVSIILTSAAWVAVSLQSCCLI